MALALTPINLAGNYPRLIPLSVPFQADATHAPSAHTAAVVTITANASRRIILERAWVSFSDTPASTLSVKDGTTVVWGPHQLTGAGPHQIDFGLCGSTGASMTVTVSDPGSGISAVLSVKARMED